MRLVIPFAEWKPDDKTLGRDGARDVRNCIPAVEGYLPLDSLTEYSANALDAYCRGAYYLKASATTLYAGDERHLYQRAATALQKAGKAPLDVITGALLSDGGGHYVEMSTPTNGDLSNFADGDLIAVENSSSNDGNYVVNGTPTANKLYITGTWSVLESAGTIINLTVRQRYETGSTDRWRFAQWEGTTIATNFANYAQSTIAAGIWEDLTTALRFRHVAVIKDFVVVGDTFDATDGAVPYRVRWCAQGDPTDWTVSASTLADYNDMVGPGGDVTGIVGGEYGVIFQEASITRMTFVGSPVVFQFDRVSDAIGCQIPGSIIDVGETIYFLSTHGFMALEQGTTLRPIGHGKVDNYVLDSLDATGTYLMSVAEWPQYGLIVWAYRTTSGSGDKADRLIIYNYRIDRWASADVEVEIITTVPKTSQIEPLLAGFNTSHKLAFFDGTDMSARLETVEFEPIPGKRALLGRTYPLIRDDNGLVFVRSRDRQFDGYTTGTAGTAMTSGTVSKRKSGKYFSLRYETNGNWSDAVGVECYFSARGSRQR